MKKKFIEVVINKCFGGFGLSDAAYEKLIELGVPVRKYVKEQRGPDGRYLPEPKNDGEIIFDRELTPRGEDDMNDSYWEFKGIARLNQRYWESWIDHKRTDPRLIAVVKELGEKADGPCAELKVVKVPAGIEWTIEEYDGIEHIAEKHRTFA